jgi:hypothetical protein
MELIPTVENAVFHPREFGKFVVIYRSSIKTFDGLVSAFIFYFNLTVEASLWDITDQEELVEKKIIKI